MSVQSEFLGTYSSLIGLLHSKKNPPEEAPTATAPAAAPTATAPAATSEDIAPVNSGSAGTGTAEAYTNGVDTRDKDPVQMNEMRGRADRSLTGYQAQVRETRKRYGRALERKGVKI